MKKLLTFVLAAACGLCAMAQNTHEGHEYVDLDLPSGTLWATCNVGAINPTDTGGYYAWGELSTKSSYTRENYYCYRTEVPNYTEYSEVDNKYVLDAEDDVANSTWGGQWFMPTYQQWTELVDSCTWKWVNTGYQATSKINGKTVFFPAVGYINENGAGGIEWGHYWSSQRPGDYTLAHVIEMGNLKQMKQFSRYEGRPVRPVCKKSDIPTAIAHTTIESLRTEAGRVVCGEEFKIFTVTGIDVTRQNGQLEGIYIVKTATAAQKVVVTR